MNNWMLVKVKYTKQLDNGALKRVAEPYLLAAMSFTDAEARIYEELGSVIRGEFSVEAISKYQVHDIFAYDDSDIWYRVKCKYEGVDSDTEKTKKVTNFFLVTAHSTKEAYSRVKEQLDGLMVDFELPAIVKSDIVEVFPYKDSSLSVELVEEDVEGTGEEVFSAAGTEA